MSLNLNVQAVDLDSSVEGVFIDYDDGISFKIGRVNTEPYVKAVKLIHKRYQTKIDSGTLNDKLSSKLMAEVMVDHIFLDWKGMKNNGEEFVYNRENALAFLNDEQYFEIRLWIMKQAANLDNFRKEEIKK